MTRRIEQGLNRVEGEVRINGRPARQGDPVALGDRLSTGADSRAMVVLGRDAFLLRERTEVQFDGGGGIATALRVLTGKILSVFEPRRAERRISTVTATMGIRGTGIYIEVEADRTYVCTCYGEVELVPVAAPAQAETVRTRHHESPRYVYARADGTAIEEAPVINHSDSELYVLEALVGRLPPFDPSDQSNY